MKILNSFENVRLPTKINPSYYEKNRCEPLTHVGSLMDVYYMYRKIE